MTWSDLTSVRGRSVFLVSQPHPDLKWAGHQQTQIIGISYIRTHGMRKVTKICTVIKLDDRKIFTGSTTPCALAKNLCDKNAEPQSVWQLTLLRVYLKSTSHHVLIFYVYDTHESQLGVVMLRINSNPNLNHNCSVIYRNIGRGALLR